MAEFRIVVPKLNVETRARGEATARPALDHVGVSAHEAAVARFNLKMADDGSPPCCDQHWRYSGFGNGSSRARQVPACGRPGALWRDA